jgi:hypothetical protein
MPLLGLPAVRRLGLGYLALLYLTLVGLTATAIYVAAEVPSAGRVTFAALAGALVVTGTAVVSRMLSRWLRRCAEAEQSAPTT